MTYQDAIPFLQSNHNAVVVSHKRNGAAQMSIVTCGPYRGGVAFTTTDGRAKLANLRRDPRCTILVSRADWSGYVVVEGTAGVHCPDRTEPEELRLTLREVYRAAAGRDHPDWEEYDRAMVEDRRAAFVVMPEHVYGAGV
jgi:PPOX class probable F420-dependent enzyme